MHHSTLLVIARTWFNQWIMADINDGHLPPAATDNQIISTYLLYNPQLTQ